MATTPQSLALPNALSPDTIETLTDLSSLLSRVRYVDASKQQSINNTLNDPLVSQLNIITGEEGGGEEGAGGGGGGERTDTITLKEFITATDQLKHKFQNARVQIKSLPGLEKSIEEQEVEMRRLEAKIEAQKGMLARLKEFGTAAKTEDVEMVEGVE